MTRGHPRHLLRAPAPGDGLSTDDAARGLPRLLRRRAVRARHRRVAGDQGHARVERRARDRALRRAHRHRARHRRARQPGQGRVGSGGAERQPRCSASPRPSASPTDSCRDCDAVSVTAVPRASRPAGSPSRHQAVGRARPRDGRDRRRRARHRRRRVHHQPGGGGAGAGQSPAPRRRPRRGGGRSTPATPTRPPASRVGPTRCACASSPRQASGCATTDVLVCQTGLIGIPMPMDPVESGIPKLGARADRPTPPAALAAADAAAHHRHRPQGHRASPSSSRRRATAHRRRHGQGCGDARARDGHDARGAHHRRRGRAGRAAARRSQTAVDDSFNALVVDGVHEHQRHRARARQRRAPATSRSPSTAGPRSTPASARRSTAACADLAHQMAADAEGATKLRDAHRARCPRRAPRRGWRRARVASSQLVQCSLYGKDPYWGRVLSELGVSGAVFDPEQVDDRLRRRHRVSRRHRVRRTTRPRSRRRWSSATSRSPATCTPATARRRCCSPTSPTPTSTRTWARQ